eukprot:1012332-Pyramimonas_sp.AAC.1
MGEVTDIEPLLRLGLSKKSLERMARACGVRDHAHPHAGRPGAHPGEEGGRGEGHRGAGRSPEVARRAE